MTGILEWKWIGIGVVVMVVLNLIAGLILGLFLAPQLESVASSEVLHCSLSKNSYRGYRGRIRYLLKRYGPVIWRLLWGDQKTRAAAEREIKQQRLTQLDV